jgi:DNA-binding NtrC family response regulator
MTASSVEQALRILDDADLDLIITGVRMQDENGLLLVRHVRENLRETAVLAITSDPSVNDAVEAVKLGADDYLARPFTDDQLMEAVEKALAKLERERRAERGTAEGDIEPPPGFIGQSETMLEVYEAIRKAARTTATVLVTGESGTGKELMGRAIHYSSARSSAPFVPVACGAIPETLLESELFGHMKGSFTGATETRAGFFQIADGGTLFLDEISETSLGMQVKLLRVLQDQRVWMIGADRPNEVDVRIIAATNKDLVRQVDKGLFREDLYYRLNVLPIELPPLRERGDDILLLVHHYAHIFAERSDRPVPRFTPEALRVLAEHSWPGNVRELENLLQRLVIMSDREEIRVPDLPSFMRFSAEGRQVVRRSLAEVEYEHMRRVLASVDGNKSRAAEILGITRKTLRERLRRYEEQQAAGPSGDEIG